MFHVIAGDLIEAPKPKTVCAACSTGADLLIEALPQRVSVSCWIACSSTLHTCHQLYNCLASCTFRMPTSQTQSSQSSHARAQLVLRSISTSRSAFVSVTYQEDFFDAYDMSGATIVQGSLPLKVHEPALLACTAISSTNVPTKAVLRSTCCIGLHLNP